MANHKHTSTSWSSFRAEKLTKTGKRPTNSGIRPYATKSPLSTYNHKNNDWELGYTSQLERGEYKHEKSNKCEIMSDREKKKTGKGLGSYRF